MVLRFTYTLSFALSSIFMLGQVMGFQWKFLEGVTSSVPQCQQLGIDIIEGAGQPPYFMIAMAQNGVPTTTNIGSDGSSLLWSVNQQAGANTLLFVVDSQGNSGGVPDITYAITSGETNCMPVPPVSTSSAKVVTNISTDGTVDFCQPIRLSVQGGEGPYILSIAGTNFPIVNNFTLDASNDAVIFYNNITPNSLFIVSVSEKTSGLWGTSTAFFTSGENNAASNCPGSEISSFSPSAQSTTSNPSTTSQSTTSLSLTITTSKTPSEPISTSKSSITPSTSRNISSQSTTADQSSSETGAITTVQSTTPSPSQTAESGSSKTPVVLISGTVGGGAALLFGLAAFSFWRLRRKGSSLDQEVITGNMTGTTSSSSLQASLVSNDMGIRLPSSANTSSGDQSHSFSSLAAGATNARRLMGRGDSTLPLLAEDSISPRMSTRSSVVIQHQDGGRVTELPPPYGTQSTAGGRAGTSQQTMEQVNGTLGWSQSNKMPGYI